MSSLDTNLLSMGSDRQMLNCNSIFLSKNKEFLQVATYNIY